MKNSFVDNNEKILFIDASRNRSGGAIVYLKNFLNYFDFKKNKIEKIIVCSYQELLDELPHNKKIILYNHSFLQKNILFQIIWQLFLLPKILEN